MEEDTQLKNMEQHLLFNRALSETGEDYDRIGGYMDILNSVSTYDHREPY